MKQNRIATILFLMIVANLLDIFIESLFYVKQQKMLGNNTLQAKRWWIAYSFFNYIYFVVYDIAIWLFTLPFLLTV